MAIGDKLFVADKQTLDTVNTKVGENTNAAGTTTLFARLKQIYDYLTGNLSSTRVAKIDNLDATISSRAAASTALSSATWTSARAANLDKIQAIMNTPNGDALGPWLQDLQNRAGDSVNRIADTQNKLNDIINNKLPAIQNSANNINIGSAKWLRNLSVNSSGSNTTVEGTGRGKIYISVTAFYGSTPFYGYASLRIRIDGEEIANPITVYDGLTICIEFTQSYYIYHAGVSSQHNTDTAHIIAVMY